jgi:hypothetical protein
MCEVLSSVSSTAKIIRRTITTAIFKKVTLHSLYILRPQFLTELPISNIRVMCVLEEGTKRRRRQGERKRKLEIRVRGREMEGAIKVKMTFREMYRMQEER